MRGLTEIDNKVYVAKENSSKLEVYNGLTFHQLNVIAVKGLEDPCDIVACRDDHQLFVAESGAIWQVSTSVRGQYAKFLTLDSTADKYRAPLMSLMFRHLLVISQPRSIHQHSTTDRRQLRVVHLPQFVKELAHAVETKRGTFVAAHLGTSKNGRQWAVSINWFTAGLYSVHVHIMPHHVGGSTTRQT